MNMQTVCFLYLVSLCFLLTEYFCLAFYLRSKNYTSWGVIANNFIADR